MNTYLENWEEQDSPKPCNDEEFIKEFIAFMKSKDSDHYEFTGDNGYCGHTAALYEVPVSHNFGRCMAFEFAYGEGFVKVFTAYHSGFWTPEYINLSGEEAKEILEILQQKGVEWLGFPPKIDKEKSL